MIPENLYRSVFWCSIIVFF